MIGPHGGNLVFLFSTPRSGSTLASAILSAHPDVLCPNEPWFLLGLAALWEGGNRTYAKYEHSSVELGLREFLSEEEFYAATRAFSITAYNQRLECERRHIFVDKTPRYFHILGFIDRLFPFSKKIWLKRNPLDVAVSYRTTWDVDVNHAFDASYGPLGLDLSLGFHCFSAFFKGQPLTFELRYEDLVINPREAIRRLCQFIEIPYVEGMERYGSDHDGLERRKKLTMGDTKLFDYDEPHARSVGRWERLLSREEIETIVGSLGRALFERMGYHDVIAKIIKSGIRFPSEDVVAAKLADSLNAAKVLPWAPR